MTKVLEDAIEKVRKLPEDRQAYVAEVLEQIVAAGGDPFVVPKAIALPYLKVSERPSRVSLSAMRRWLRFGRSVACEAAVRSACPH
jgi:hypothetical protein